MLADLIRVVGVYDTFKKNVGYLRAHLQADLSAKNVYHPYGVPYMYRFGEQNNSVQLFYSAAVVRKVRVAAYNVQIY